MYYNKIKSLLWNPSNNKTKLVSPEQVSQTVHLFQVGLFYSKCFEIKKKKVLIISVLTVHVVLLNFQKATESICLFNKYQNSFQDTAVPFLVMMSYFVQLLSFVLPVFQSNEMMSGMLLPLLVMTPVSLLLEELT